jgi:glycosyltransferase involved in cell wall biosynthesis
MNILFYLSRYPGYGGIEKVTTVLVNYFVNTLGYNVSILSVEQDDDENLLQELDSTVVIYKLPFSKNLLTLRNVELLNSIIRSNNIDIVIYQDSYARTELLLNCINIEIKPKIIVVEHNTPNSFVKSYNYNWKHNKSKKLLDLVKRILYVYFVVRIYISNRNRHIRLINLSDKYVVLSNKFIPLLKKIFLISNSSKVIAIGNPLTLEQLPLCKKNKICLFVGRLSSQKGVDKLLQIWEIIGPRNPEWKLQIVGDGELRLSMESYIVEHCIKNISIEGFHSNMVSYYQRASILCMTSIFEGWGLVLTEAMAYGVVPIAFNSYASASEIIDHGRNGFLIKPFDKLSYITNLEKMMSNNQLLEGLSVNAIEKSKCFRIERIAKQWDDCFINLLRSK